MLEELQEAVEKRQEAIEAWRAEQIAYDLANHLAEPNPAQDVTAFIAAVDADVPAPAPHEAAVPEVTVVPVVEATKDETKPAVEKTVKKAEKTAS